MTTWKVSTNCKLFNYKKAQGDFDAYKKGKRTESVKIYQSKGNAKMVKCPKIGDIVYFSSNKIEVLIGKVVSEFSEGTLHHQCPYNIRLSNEVPTHQETQIYAVIEITKIGSGLEFKGVQRTWSKKKD